MAGLRLRIIDGLRKGAEFPVSPGLTIGRTQGDIQLRDQRVSALHCRVDQLGDSLLLVDLGSSNRIKIDAGKVERLELRPGIRFTIGSTVFEVEEEAAPPQQEPTFVTSGEPDLKDWRANLADELEKISKAKLKGPGRKIQLFQPFLTLEFIAGPQTGDSWYLAYGPRMAGAVSPDLEIKEPGAPNEAFDLIPDGNKGALLKTKFPELVSLNDLPVVTERLKEGDVISVHKTRIIVKYKS